MTKHEEKCFEALEKQCNSKQDIIDNLGKNFENLRKHCKQLEEENRKYY